MLLDLTSLLVTFKPSGLGFSNEDPAILTFWYGVAAGDMDGDGEEEDDDEEIESTLLGLWTQEFAGDSWYPVDAEHESSENLFEASIYHFTNYAVGWIPYDFTNDAVGEERSPERPPEGLWRLD